MICPKCQDLMRTITRGAVHIDQCDNCKGVFLDGGELEQILAAERDHYAQAPPYAGTPQEGAYAGTDGAPPPYAGTPQDGAPPPYAGPQPGAGGAPPPYQPPPGTPPPGTPAVPPGYPPAYPPGYYGPPGHHPPRRRSFLEELLD
ncbi:zf-TFIIB domain-containing protein [Actinosynnema sp. NPDC050436]|uniref:TFIIB-type zinc ribbon-containing protein n=1 Tax=Actinosynnema sp. NPDC050436 TaxID=3155659 RepID=UPI0033E326CB